jgi:4-amino-4-deoxy-L-arabinose transferase-like glycosyltransferase
MGTKKELNGATIALFLALAGFLISFATTSGNTSYWWDDAEYLILSQSLTDYNSYEFFGTRSFRPPFLPVYAAYFNALTGLESKSFLIPFFSAISVLAVFVIGRKFFDSKTGIIASIFLLTNHIFVLLGSRFYPDVPLLFISGISLLFFQKSFEKGRMRDFIFTSILCAIGFLLSYRFVILIASYLIVSLIFWKSAILKKWKEIGVAILAFIGCIFPLLYYSQNYYNSPFGIFKLFLSLQQNDSLGAMLATVIEVAPNMIPLIVLAFWFAFKRKQKTTTYLLAFSTVIFIISFISLMHQEQRYFMPIFPAFFVFVAAFVREIGISLLEKNNIEILKLKNWKSNALAILCLILFFVSIIAGSSLAYLYYEGQMGVGEDFKSAGLYVKENTVRNDILMADTMVSMIHSERFSRHLITKDLEYFKIDMESYKPKFIILTRKETPEINKLNLDDLGRYPPNTPVEYIFFRQDKFKLEKEYPSEINPQVFVFRVIGA